ncbi:MAG TPA: VC0807 family protein [Actinomycetota bacterium]
MDDRPHPALAGDATVSTGSDDDPADVGFSVRFSAIAWQVLPGMVLPGIIYFLVSRQASVLVALAAASTVPLLDGLVRIVRRQPPNAATGLFVVGTSLSVALAFWSGSGLFILAKGAVISGLLGITFVLSAAVGRPLTRTLALRLSAQHPEGRRRLAERWMHPSVTSVFRVLSAGWGVLLLGMAAQQTTMALTLPPGLAMTLEGPVHLTGTAIGVAVSLLYVRRRQQADPAVTLLPTRTR